METYELLDKEAMGKAINTMSQRFARMFAGLFRDLEKDGKVSLEDSQAMAHEMMRQFEQAGIVKKV